MSSSQPCHSTFFLDEFARRQWEDPDHAGTRLTCDPAEFVRRVEEAHRGGAQLREGYAPFCKHVFIPNFTDATVGAEAVTPQNAHLLRSGYQKRRPEEAAVLARWFPRTAVAARRARCLDVICYSREQLLLEHAALPFESRGAAPGSDPGLPPAPWGIISIKAQDEDYETPMQVGHAGCGAATGDGLHSRNARGVEDGHARRSTDHLCKAGEETSWHALRGGVCPRGPVRSGPWGGLGEPVMTHDATAHAALHRVPQPITIMRNALGREEGGSGVPLDKQKYAEAVEYWEKHAIIQ